MPPHWDGLTEYLNSLGTVELSQRWKKARQIIQEHGSAYNVFNPKSATERPWALDPIPLPISSHTWQILEHGIQQRTKLLALIFRDIYGRQEFIKKRVLHAELIFGNPGFLRQCRFGPDRVPRITTCFLRISSAWPMAGGRWRSMGPRHRPGSDMPWKIALSLPGFCPGCFTPERSSGWPRFLSTLICP
jgi:hypothetical protein